MAWGERVGVKCLHPFTLYYIVLHGNVCFYNVLCYILTGCRIATHIHIRIANMCAYVYVCVTYNYIYFNKNIFFEK